jgi:CreA protein
VKFDGEIDVVEAMVKTATFYDPDGNALMLAEDLTGGA